MPFTQKNYKLLALTALLVTTLPAVADSARKPLEGFCNAGELSSVVSQLGVTEVKIHKIHNGPSFKDGTRFVAASNKLPAYCQVTGSFVTNPETGKTANFLATFPEDWNGKYLQLGCFSHCGAILINDAASVAAPIIIQGHPGQLIEKGYASFGTDQGHQSTGGGNWAIKGPGEVDEDAIKDFFYRANQVLANMGKAFTTEFYAALKRARKNPDYSYFAGCSGGGRDAFVAASYFPEEFDGIVGGSAYDPTAVAFHRIGDVLATIRSPEADVSPELVALIDPIVKAQCDERDGVKDGLIQNPAACEFDPMHDLPKCEQDASQPCFTETQRKTVSAALTGVTDEEGNLVAPGYSISEFQATFRPEAPTSDPAALEPWGETGNSSLGNWEMGNATIKTFANKNDPDFYTRHLFKLESGGKGPITGFRSVVPRSAVTRVQTENRMGIGHTPQNWSNFIAQDRKFLMWHNWSDEALTPYLSTNFYLQLAQLNGGIETLQHNVRLFMLPGTSHCSIGGVGPKNFDAISAIEDWVEKGKAPNSLPAKLYPPSPIIKPEETPLRTMPLCKFPEMARYNGKGDVNDADNWHCPEGDDSLLEIGASGRQAGAISINTP